MFLNENPRSKTLDAVPAQYLHAGLTKNRPGIQLRCDFVYAATGLSVTCSKRPRMGMKPRISRQKGRMNVQHSARISSNKARRQNAHEPCLCNDVGSDCVKLLRQRYLKRCAVGTKRAVIHARGSYAKITRFGQTSRLGQV